MANNIYLFEGVIQVKDLTFNERAFVSLIYQLNGFDPQTYKREFYANYLNVDGRSISRYITTCVQKGYINVEYDHRDGVLLTPTEKTIDLCNAYEVL